MNKIGQITGCISSCRFFRFSSTKSYSFVLAANYLRRELLDETNFWKNPKTFMNPNLNIFWLTDLESNMVKIFFCNMARKVLRIRIEDGLREEMENSLRAVHLLNSPGI